MKPPVSTAAGYHRATSYQRHRLTPHSLDWANAPQPTKTYPHLDVVPLDRDAPLPAVGFADLVKDARMNRLDSPAALNRERLSALLQLTQAITARSMHGVEPFYYRSVASAGALYPFELYLAVHHIDGVAPGVYHFDLFDFSLTTLRPGPVPIIPPVEHAVAATIYVSGIFFRSAWKYRGRSYRYVLLDAGHLLENLRLALAALGLAFAVHLDFDDDQATTLLGLDPHREACLVGVHVIADGGGEAKLLPPNGLHPLSEAIVHASTVSPQEVTYAEILQAHRAGYGQPQPADGPRTAIDCIGRPPSAWLSLSGAADSAVAPGYIEVLGRRRSRRNFIPTPLSEAQLKALLDLIGDAVDADSSVSLPAAVTIGLIVGDGQPLPAGFYRFDPHGRRLGQLSVGDLTNAMAAACLDQMWLKNAALHLLFLTDPAALDRVWGARGYRNALIEAGRLGQQAYLAATALGLGACGVGAIYDQEAADLLDLTDDGALLYLVGIGPVKRA